MATKDHENYYSGLAEPTAQPSPVPNTVSRSPKVGDRSFQTVVFQSGKAVLDSEIQLQQDANQFAQRITNRWQAPSGWFRGQTRLDSYCDFVTESNAVSLTDDAPSPLTRGATLVNSFILPRMEALVAGFPVVVEFTNTRTPGWNLIGLEEPTVYDGGSPATVKRTDFVFLEVWKALVAPSPKASGEITVVDFAQMVAGDTITINGVVLTAVAGAPAVDQFQIGANNDVTATNIATAINATANSFDTIVSARANADVVTVQAVTPGAAGNAITLAEVSAGLAVSGATLTGGVDYPNKPTQSTLYRHGNTLSPVQVALVDELEDPVVNEETTQRIQVQYRIRSTGAAEATNYKKHPDGFSTVSGGTATIFAQGGRATVASGTLINGLAQGGAATTITLAAASSAVDDFYTGSYISITNNSPVGALGQIRKITAYNGTTKVATVNTAWTVNPNATTTYQIAMESFPFVPADRSTIWLDSDATAFDIEDPGLWVAGDGSEAAAIALGSADGFVYAIPIAFVHRHNDASSPVAMIKGFDPETNSNGAPLSDHAGYNGFVGVIPALTSDRPDGHFADVITQENLLDLRRHILLGGVDTSAELQYQIQSLLDGSVRTWSVDGASKNLLGNGSGDVSTRFLVCNEIGRTVAHDGIASTRGDLVREFDHIARRFGDQSVVERVVFSFYPGDRVAGPAFAPGLVNPGKYVTKAGGSSNTAWYEGDVLHLDLDALSAATLGGIFQGLSGGGSSLSAPSQISKFMPVGTAITDVLSIYHDDGNYNAAIDQQVRPTLVHGLGTMHLAITLDANPLQANGGGDPAVLADYDLVGSGVTLNGSPRRIFVEVEITYPIGEGTTDTVYHEVTPDPTVYNWNGAGAGMGPVIEDDVTQRPNDMESLLAPRFREGYREIQVEYVGNDTVSLAGVDQRPGAPVGENAPFEYIVSRTTTTLYFPRRVLDERQFTSVTEVPVPGAKNINHAQTEYGSSSRKVTLDDALSAAQTLCQIKYFAQDPIPNYGDVGGGYQLAVYFRTNAPQTAGVKEGNLGTSAGGTLPTTLHVEPLFMSPDLWTGQIGSGSQDRAFPYLAPLDQIPVNQVGQPTPVYEWYFCGTADVTIDDFNASTGLIAVRPFVPADGQNIMEFGGAAADRLPRADADFRAYYPFAANWIYRPTVMSQPLYGAVRHKVLYPFLARAVEEVHCSDGNGLLYRKNELLLIVLTRFAELDEENNVRFTDSNNRTCAALYRTRNLLLLVGDRACPVPIGP